MSNSDFADFSVESEQIKEKNSADTKEDSSHLAQDEHEDSKESLERTGNITNNIKGQNWDENISYIEDLKKKTAWNQCQIEEEITVKLIFS